MRVDVDDLSDAEEIFLADSWREARQVEERLTAAGVDYAVAVAPIGRTLFGSVRMGAVFSVTAVQAAHCREQLASAGFRAGIVHSDE